MDRLTDDQLYLNSIHFAVLCNFTPFCGEERAKETNEFLKKVFANLKAYEVTGLTPSEIMEIKAKMDGEYEKVVRCGECKCSEPLQPHADLYNKDLMNCTCQHGEEVRNVWHKYSKQYRDYSLVEPDDFCSFGEKKEG